MRETRDAPWRLEIVDRIGSTNDALIERAERGEAGRVALLARRQEAARGSRGRVWREPSAGNLALSVLLRGGDWGGRSGGVIFAASLALADALAPFVMPPCRLVLKWPNDVLLSAPKRAPGKVAGILIETGRPGNEAMPPDWMVIGFGANLLAAPDIEGACALADAGGPVAGAEVVARRLLERLDHWFALMADDDARGAIRSAWLERAHPPGTPIDVEGGGLRRSGRFEGLDGNGALLLRTSSGLERISTGTVLLGDRTSG